VAIAFALLACSSTSKPAPPRVHRVVIHAMTFDPPELDLRTGDIVEWRNDDLVPHTATAAGAFDSATIAPAATWRTTAARPGDLAYACTLHPTMRGVLHIH
jgi:plastocyanin